MKRAALFGLVVTGCVMSATLDRERTGTRSSALSAPVNIATFESYAATFGSVQGFTVLGSKVLFGAQTGLEGVEPWVTDGTGAGTSMIRDMNPGLGNGFIASARLASSAILGVNDGAHGAELWMSDGTLAGTTLLKDLYAGSYGFVTDVRSSGGFVYASASSGS